MLLELVVSRLGHQPVAPEEAAADDLAVDAAIVEPGMPGGLDLARSLAAEGTPLLFASIYPADAAALALEPTAYLVKPFPLYALERALADALVCVRTTL